MGEAKLKTGSTSIHLYELARPIWQKQFEHPFVTSLGDGSLPQENFRFYICQDALFLNELTKIFGYATTRSQQLAHMERFGELLLNTIRVEQELHRSYAQRFGMSPEEMLSVEMAPTNYAYTSHLHAVASVGTLPEIITAILPCAWIYAEVGKYFSSQGTPASDHPYRDWLLTYSSDDFEQVGAWLRQVLDESTIHADDMEISRLEKIFITSSRYEWMFWDMAWRQEQWPV
ncbi:transcriptional activator, TenA family [Thermobaculum terrenum ATCC BAA-798]|uniref:Aminopyrimidine aminohydrolase n=1 Tax=Thermobaculum terrenum (strain ATCC BAA-798 / CCMEE 7001 / YNP1) TaxID=525904 RepID=D1CF55_THET1|nr:thiaminase II [Thermobaculum terrenum]ACZ41561.1 transcriptional activator, TenA family [Thermobaculum terrenum ATCC BAA-798]